MNVYFDNAERQNEPGCIDAMIPCLENVYANVPSSTPG